MEFLRNTIAVLLGLGIAMLAITFGLRLNSAWITYAELSPFKNWGRLLEAVKDDEGFFFALLISSGVGSTIGGIVTALVVKYAKVAYAMLIGFILLFIAVLDIIIFPHHPVFYQIGIFLTFFPSSWVGGKIVEVIHERAIKKKKKKLQS
ncbi:MAG: hypothetical protein KBA33_06725 [Cloacibacterium sp.]|jgi:hypothetical protein|nr:hypothetical protein [Cloacibacterium sp.]